MKKYPNTIDDIKLNPVLDFLLTYGWIILVVLAIIGLLLWFGTILPNKATTEVNVTQCYQICDNLVKGG